MLRLLSRIIRRQDGIAMPVVIGTMTLTTGLAAATFAVVIEGNHASARDRDSKAALAAAEAGLQMAILKTTELKPGDTQCVTNSLVAPGSASNDGSTTAATECPRWKASLGNGATYTYVVATPTTGTCPTVPGFTATPGKDRCITSTGEVNGIKRRLQLRFYFNPPFVPWGNAGLVGKHSVDIEQNATLNSPVGSNELVTLGENSIITNEVLIPNGAQFKPDNHAKGATGGVRTPRVAPWVFPEMDWDTPRNEGLSLAGVPGWNPETRILTLDNQQQVTLPGGTYHVCGINAPNGNFLNVSGGGVVHLYIDSPRGTDACPNVPGAGRLVVDNKGRFNAPEGVANPDPAQLAIFLYGTTEDATETDPDVEINNNAQFNGMLWAPNSTVSFWNNGDSSGGITAGRLKMKNNAQFEYSDRVTDKSLPGTATARNLSWFECKRDPTTATDPESGC